MGPVYLGRDRDHGPVFVRSDLIGKACKTWLLATKPWTCTLNRSSAMTTCSICDCLAACRFTSGLSHHEGAITYPPVVEGARHSKKSRAHTSAVLALTSCIERPVARPNHGWFLAIVGFMPKLLEPPHTHSRAKPRWTRLRHMFMNVNGSFGL